MRDLPATANENYLGGRHFRMEIDRFSKKYHNLSDLEYAAISLAWPVIPALGVLLGDRTRNYLGESMMTEFHILFAGDSAVDPVEIRQINVSDIIDALRQGYMDFMKKPSHYIFVVIIYPIIGVGLFSWASGGNTFQLLFPMMAGFALLGPVAALGLYEISRRLEMNADTSWVHALDVRKSPAIPAIIAVGAMLVGFFVAWLAAAQALYLWLYGSESPGSLLDFFGDVISTQRGWTLIVMGNGVGFIFAVLVLCTTVIAFPLLLDRDVGAVSAIKASARAVLVNPVPMFSWGIIVAVCLFLGALPGLAGLLVVLPVLGHATWHIYRKVVVGSRPVAA